MYLQVLYMYMCIHVFPTHGFHIVARLKTSSTMATSMATEMKKSHVMMSAGFRYLVSGCLLSLGGSPPAHDQRKAAITKWHIHIVTNAWSHQLCWWYIYMYMYM